VFEGLGVAENKSVEQDDLTDMIARQFVEARLAARALAAFPGQIPADLATGYRHQEAAIRLFPDEIAGWKIGRVGPEFEDRFGRTRLAGPIFAKAVRRANGREPVVFPVFKGGFAAIEAEFVFGLGHDAPAAKLVWTLDEARAIAGDMHIGIETAGSPLATINALGPTVVATDFGNNAGLILGPAVADWRARADKDLTCESFIEGISVGKGAASDLPGGPVEALRFLLEHCAARGRPLKAGQLISTGAATGIHDIAIGQRAHVDFGALGTIECVAVAADSAAQNSRAARA
jgi:2-keto-4-pentenoate hydratase